MRILHRSMTDVIAGTATSAVGLFVVIQSWAYPMGTARDMGPGYFPTIAGIALILLGIGIVLLEGRLPSDEKPEFAEARPILLIMASIGVFALVVESYGLGPAAFLSVFLAALADRSTSLLFAGVLALLVAVASVLLFIYGLGLTIPAMRW